MEIIITQLMIDTIKKSIKTDNTICDMSKHILKSIAKEAKEDKRVSIYKVRDLLAIQNVFITAHDEELTSKNISKEQIKERIEILNVLQEMTKSLFDDASNALNKRLNEFKNECQDEYEDDLNKLTKDELIDLVKHLEEKTKEK